MIVAGCSSGTSQTPGVQPTAKAESSTETPLAFASCPIKEATNSTQRQTGGESSFSFWLITRAECDAITNAFPESN